MIAVAASRAFALVAAVLLALPQMAMAQAAPSPVESLEARMTHVLRDEALDGAVWSLVRMDGSQAVGAAGTKDRRTGAPMTIDTRVQVGSVTKVLLAVGVLRLITEGKLSLDDEVSGRLPGIRFENPWQASDPVRVRHLLAHSAGLENLRLWQFFSLRPDADTPLAAAFEQGVNPLQVQTRPGSRFGYSNIGYTLLGGVIESVTGERYETYLDRALLAPLALHDSTFRFTTQTGPDADPRLAMGHFEDGQPQAIIPLYLRPAAQFTTTAADMATLARFLMGDGRIGDEAFIAPELMAELTAPRGTEAQRAGLAIGHGHALAVRDRHRVVGACHPGTTVGFRAMFCLFPEHRAAFFLANNTDNESADYERAHALLIDALALPATPAMAAGRTESELQAWEGYYTRTPAAMPHLAPLAVFTDTLRVRVDGDTLTLGELGSDERTLVAMGGRLFRAENRQRPSHVLLHAADGTRILSDGLRNYRQIDATAVLLPRVALAIAASGWLATVVIGLLRLFRRRLGKGDPTLPPLLATACVLLSLLALSQQSLLQLGDRTFASMLLAVATALLPMALLVGTVQALSRRRDGHRLVAAALLATLPGLLLLLVWGMLPLRLWTW